MFARVLLELANSFLDARRLRQEKLLAFRKPFAGSHSIKCVRRDRKFRLAIPDLIASQSSSGIF